MHQTKQKTETKKVKGKKVKKEKKKITYQKKWKCQKDSISTIGSTIKPLARVEKKPKNLCQITYCSYNKKNYCSKNYIKSKAKNS